MQGWWRGCSELLSCDSAYRIFSTTISERHMALWHLKLRYNAKIADNGSFLYNQGKPAFPKWKEPKKNVQERLLFPCKNKIKCATWKYFRAANKFLRIGKVFLWIGKVFLQIGKVFLRNPKYFCASLRISPQLNKYLRTHINIFPGNKVFLHTVQMFSRKKKQYMRSIYPD